MANWISWNIDIPRSLNFRDSYPRRKCENRAPISCRPDPMLLSATISFELHSKMAEKIDLEICSYGQYSKVQKLRDLDLYLGSGQGQTGGHIRSRSIHTPNWIEIGKKTLWTSVRTYGRTHLISNPKNRAPTSCRPGFILSPPTISFALHAKTAEEIDLE